MWALDFVRFAQTGQGVPRQERRATAAGRASCPRGGGAQAGEVHAPRSKPHAMIHVQIRAGTVPTQARPAGVEARGWPYGAASAIGSPRAVTRYTSIPVDASAR